MEQEKRYYIWDIRQLDCAMFWAILITLMLGIFGVIAQPTMVMVMLGLFLVDNYRLLRVNRRLRRELKAAKESTQREDKS